METHVCPEMGQIKAELSKAISFTNMAAKLVPMLEFDEWMALNAKGGVISCGLRYCPYCGKRLSERHER